MGIIKTIDDLIKGIEIDNPEELSTYFEARKIPHYYCWNSLCVPANFNSIIENPKLLFSIETGDEIKSRVKLLVKE